MVQKIIDRFDGTEYRWLSNFYYVDGRWTTEHIYQAMKTLDPREQMVILQASTPAMAKKFGRKVLVREDWDTIKDEVMLRCLRLKFTNPELRQKLLDTGDAILIEGNDWGDRYWGQVDGVGKNMLGVLLMKVREEIRHEQDDQEDKTS